MELLGDRFNDLNISVNTSRSSDINGGILLVDVAFSIDSDTANAEALTYTLNNQLPQIFQNPNAYYSIRVDLHGLVAAGMNYHRITAFAVMEVDADADVEEDEQQSQEAQQEQDDQSAQAPPLAQPYEIGTLIGGGISRQGINQPSMPFAVNANATGEFVIAHVGSLNRLMLRSTKSRSCFRKLL